MSDNQGDGGKITPGGFTLPSDAPAGILDFLVGIQANESGFDYDRDQGSPAGSIGTYGGGAAEGFGAYQFTGPDSSQVQQAVADNWNPASQDEIAYNLALGYWNQWHDWAKVTEAWYGPGTVGQAYNDVTTDVNAPSYPDWQNVKAALQGHANLPTSWVYGPGNSGLTSEQIQQEIGGTIVPESSGQSSTFPSGSSSGGNVQLTSADISSMNTAGQICAQIDAILNPLARISPSNPINTSILGIFNNPLGALSQDLGIPDVASIETDAIAIAQMIAFRSLFAIGFLLMAAVGIDSLLKGKERFPLKLAGSKLGGRGPGLLSFFKTGGAGEPGQKPPSLNQMIALQREQRQQARQDFNSTIASAREARIALATQHRQTLTEQAEARRATEARSKARNRNARLRFEQSEAARKTEAEARRIAEDASGKRRERQRQPKRVKARESIPE